MFSRRMLIYSVMLAVVSADLTCILDHENNTHIKCSHDGRDYVLKRGLISDNDSIVKATLSGCRITDIDYEAFHRLPSLTHIDLHHNKLTQIKLGALDDLRNVTDIDLSDNKLTGLPLGLFDKNENLIKLKLQGNRIEKLELGIFDPLRNLKYLYLTSNGILGKYLDPHIFDHNQHITHIWFTGNNMSGASDELLHAFQAIDLLDLDRCMLEEVPAFATRDNLKTMILLSLTGNQIAEIDNPRTFNNLEHLAVLNIGYNKLNRLNEAVFKPLEKLNVISLRNNYLQSIPENLFTNMRSLIYIDLANNFLTYIPVNAFNGTTVKTLNLSNNRFSYLPDNFCSELTNSGAQIQKFHFHQNPWQCMCLLDILKEVNELKIEYKRMEYDEAQDVCVSTKLVCKRQDSLNQIYIDLYNNLINKD